MPENRAIRVFAPGFYTYRNKGDATLVLAFIAWLRTAFDDPQITLTSFEPADSAHFDVPVLEMATRPLRPLKIIGHRIGGRIPGVRGLIPYLVYSYTATVFWLLRRWVSVYRSQPDIAARLAPAHILRLTRAIDAADVVITVPGGYLLAPALVDDWWLFHLPTLELARALGKPVILSPCSIGPFAGFHRDVAGRFLRSCERIYLREEWSRDYVLGLGVSADRVTCCPDLAFMFRDGDIETVAPIEISGVDSGDDQPLLGISVKWHSFPGSDDPKARRRLYMKALADTADSMIELHGARVVIVPQTLEDLKAGRALYAEIGQRDDVVLLEDDLSPADLQCVYARCRILIGTRMHANILAMGVGTPVVAIAYQPKTTGIMAAMGLDDWVLSIDDVSGLVARAHNLWIHADDVREVLPGKVQALRAEAASAARELRAVTTEAGRFTNRPDMSEERKRIGACFRSDNHRRPSGGQLMGIEQASLSFEQALGLLRRRAPWILLCFALAVAAAYGFSKHQTKQYTATSSLVFSTNQLSQEVAGLQAVGSGATPQALQNTNVKLVQLGDMAARTAALLGKGLSKEKVSAALTVSAAGESNIVDVAATASSPALAAGIANTYTEEFVKEQQNSNHAYYASALALVNKQLAALTPAQRAGTAGLALEDRAQSLGTLAELRNGSVQIAQAATVPTSPSSPKVARNTALGGFVGLLLGLAVAFLLERFDRRVREPKDLEEVYGLPLLGVVPESAALSRSAKGKGKNARQALPASETEAFHLIRAHLRYFNVDRELRMLLIASAAPGDGKTTVARHLAGAAARMGSRVLLLEADLRRPTVARQLDVLSGPGVSDVLIGAVALNEATQTIDLDQSSANGRAPRTLDVLVAGAVLPPNPGELIESHAMEALLEQVRSTYDLVVVDTPPLTAVSDAFPLLGKVDGVIIVGRVGRNRRDVAERLHQTLMGAGAPLLGVVANGLKSGRRGSYGYAYGYAPTDTERSAPPPAASTNGASRNGASAAEPVPSIKA